MSNVGNSGESSWDFVSVLENIYDFAADSSPVKGAINKAKSCAGGVLSWGISKTANGAGYVLGVASPTLVNRALKLIKPMIPLLEGDRERLLNSIVKYDQYELTSQAILSFERHKISQPTADFNTLQALVMVELGQEKAANLFAAAREVFGTIPRDDQLLEQFFTRYPQEILRENERKQDEILEGTFQEAAAAGLGWVLLSAFPKAPKFMLNLYRDMMKAPMREAGLVNELAGILYKGSSLKDELPLPKSQEAEEMQNSLEWKKMLYKEAGVSNAAEFLNNILAVCSKKISGAVREEYFAYINKDTEEAVVLSDFATEHVKIALLKCLNNIATHNIDDVRTVPNGKTSKTLPANIILNLSKLLNSHKEDLRTKVTKLRKKGLSENERKVEYRKIFKGMSSELVQMLGINPLDDIDILDNLPILGAYDLKNSLWKQVEDEIIPEVLGDYYFSLTQWEAEKEVNEKIIESRSGHALGAIDVMARYTVEKAQNFLAVKPNKVGKMIKESLTQKCKDVKSAAGNKAAEFLNAEENASSIKSVWNANLPLLAKEEALWDTVEGAVQPVMVKLSSELIGKIGKIEDKKGSGLFLDISLKVFQQFTSHMKNINAVRDEFHAGDVADVSKAELAGRVFSNEHGKGKSKKSDPVVDKNYIEAKKKFYAAKEKLENLKNIRFRAANAYNTAKTRFGFSINFVNNYLSEKADESIKNVKVAKIELKAAEKEYAEQTKIKHAKPMGLQLLKLLNVTEENLPLPKDQESMRKLVWESLTDDILPAALQSMVETITDKDTINSGLLSFLETIKPALMNLEEKDLNEEGVHRRLETIAGDSNRFPGSSKVAKEILDLASKGESLSSSMRQILTANPSALGVMKHHFNEGCAALPHIRLKFESMLVEAKEAEQIKDSHGNGFDKACGEGIKEFLDMLPSWTRNVNFMKVKKFQDLAAEGTGKIVRESLGQWTLQKVIDKAMESVATNLSEGGTWEKKSTKVDGQDVEKMVFTKPPKVNKTGHTRDFHLPLTPEAEREYKIKQVLKNKEIDNKVHREMTTVMSFVKIGVIKVIISSAWQKFLEGIYYVIDAVLSKRAPRLHDALKTVISFLLEKLFAKSVQTFFASIWFVLEKPFIFIMEKLFTSGQAASFIEWTHMEHVHNEFVWDAMATAIDETIDKAAEVGA